MPIRIFDHQSPHHDTYFVIYFHKTHFHGLPTNFCKLQKHEILHPMNMNDSTIYRYIIHRYVVIAGFSLYLETFFFTSINEDELRHYFQFNVTITTIQYVRQYFLLKGNHLK